MADLRTIIAIDQGTTSSRAILDEAGTILVQHRPSFRSISRRMDGRHDLEDIWQTVIDVTTAIVTEARSRGIPPIAIGITNQRETAVIWDRAIGKLIHNATSGGPADRQHLRGNEECRQGSYDNRKDRASPRPLFHRDKASRILTRSRARATVLPASCVLARSTAFIWRPTGGRMHFTDATNASRTSLYNIHENDWDDDPLALFDVPVPGYCRHGCAAEFGICEPGWCRIAHPRRCRRPAGYRPGLFYERRVEIHLWHRMLCDHQYR